MNDLRESLARSGATGVAVASLDWSATPVGPLRDWPPCFRVATQMALASGFPLCLVLGHDPASAVIIYNDAFSALLGQKHPWALGRRARDVWPEIWDFLGWMLRQVWQTARSVSGRDLVLRVERGERIEEIYLSISWSPILDDGSCVCGAIACCIETTSSVVTDRRERALRSLIQQLGAAPNEHELYRSIERALGAEVKDVAFALLYIAARNAPSASLRAAVGLSDPVPERLKHVDLRAGAQNDAPWELGRVVMAHESVIVDAASVPLSGRLALLGVAPRRAAVLPVARSAQQPAVGALVVGLSAVHTFDEAYGAFVQSVAREIATALAHVRSVDETRRRAKSLAELDRAKTMFLTHVSHELRTPLTLIVGPVEDLLLDDRERPSPVQRVQLECVRDNAQRLMRYVDALLDFVRVDAGRVEVSFEPTDLAAFTRAIALAFEPAVTRAGLRLEVDCPPLPEPVSISRDMWERIVLNLLSNALKFTFAGEIAVTLRSVGRRVRLTVRDTGTGIPESALPRLFDRFYRVPRARARTGKGLGIGLAMVKECVRLHRGSVRVQSRPGAGTTFTIEIPRGRAAAAPERASAEESPAFAYQDPTPFADDALGAFPRPEAALVGHAGHDGGSPSTTPGPAGRARILVSEDDPQMREYLVRLLAPAYDVEATADGRAALETALSRPPDLILSDVLMPEIDGISLVSALRKEPKTSATPIVLLSARGGEDAAVEALGSGADDYLVKPFCARELRARVRTHLELAQTRREAGESRLKDVFLGLASHELRTPLTCLKLNVQLVQREVQALDAGLAGRLAGLSRSIDRLTRLIEDMLSVSAIITGQLSLRPSACDVREICRVAASEQALVTRRQLTLDLPDAPVPALADEERIGEVVANLLSNAFKYSPANKPVALSLRASEREAIVTVRDEGAGIAPSELSRIFERFYRVQGQRVQAGSYVGLGLGLFLSKTIVEQHHGRIWVESTPGEGSAFSFALPMAA